MKILSSKDLIFISRTLVIKARGNTLTSNDILNYFSPKTFQPSFSNGYLLSPPIPFTHLYIHMGLGCHQELDGVTHKKSYC